MLNITQFRELIVKPALRDLVLDSVGAEELLVFTCANESLGGTYLAQVKGPALGIYQMEPETYNDIWQNYINNHSRLAMIMATNFGCSRMPVEDRLIWDLRFATAMARIHYARAMSPLPLPGDVEGIWEYYKTHYNTSKGAAEKVQAIANYRAFNTN